MPEEVRKFMAIALLVLAALVLFFAWGKITSSRLTTIAPGPAAAPDFITNPPEESSQTLSPAAGIIDTIKSIEELWRP